MKWDIHIYDPKTETTKTHVKDYPGTSSSMADAPSVVAKASRDFKKHMKYILAVPHRGSHATKRKSPAQLDREIAHAMKSDRWDAGPDAWQRGYEFAKESSRHETRAEQREVLRRVAPGASVPSCPNRKWLASIMHAASTSPATSARAASRSPPT